jgi:hypothetical protein
MASSFARLRDSVWPSSTLSPIRCAPTGSWSSSRARAAKWAASAGQKSMGL